jgi:hypothetical protein
MKRFTTASEETLHISLPYSFDFSPKLCYAVYIIREKKVKNHE